jgi:hypothetical protein
MSNAKEKRDPKKDPEVGDVLSLLGSSRQVEEIRCDLSGLIHIGWNSPKGDGGWMRLVSWRRWAKNAEVIHAVD